MKKVIIALLVFMAGAIPSQAQNKMLLAAGTDVPVVVEKEYDAYKLKEGQMIGLCTAEDVKTEADEVVIPKGSSVYAKVRTGLKQRVLVDQKRRLIIDIKEVRLSDGTKIPLCNGVVSFTVSQITGDLDAVPLKYSKAKVLIIPLGHVMTAKVEVSQNISK